VGSHEFIPDEESAMELSRRKFLRLAAATSALPITLRMAHAEPYPSRPITLVVPVAAGGGVDTAARILAENLQAKLKQSVVVENRPGAGSMVGASVVARANPDGYVLLLMEPATVLAKWLNKAVPYDVTTDFAPIAQVATQPLVLFAHPSLPANDVKELIAYCKANPRKVSVGTAGIGSPHHLAVLWLNAATKIEITHVPYRGIAPALNDLLGGQIQLVWALPVAAMPFLEQGKIKALGVSTRQRFPLLPQVPTIAESGVPGFDLDFFYGIAGPAKMPPESVARIAQAVGDIIDLPDVRARMSALGMSVDFHNSDQFRELIATEYRKYGLVIRDAGIMTE
jgi:tripartite-type tricarboxylate transporter receptor subunit TctC